MKALSIRQPYAWLVATGRKPVENRTWSTEYRGPVLIHAAIRMHDNNPLGSIEQKHGIKIPTDLHRGGFVGHAELVRVVVNGGDLPEYLARWRERFYSHGWVLQNAYETNFVPYGGKQGLFTVPPDIVRLIRRAQ